MGYNRWPRRCQNSVDASTRLAYTILQAIFSVWNPGELEPNCAEFLYQSPTCSPHAEFFYMDPLDVAKAHLLELRLLPAE